MPAPDIALSPTLVPWQMVGAHIIHNNPWGAGAIQPGTAPNQYEQYCGVSPVVGTSGEVAFRMKWRWPTLPDTEVKGYPAILTGKKPGYYSPNYLMDGEPVRMLDGSISQRAPCGDTIGTFMPLQLPLGPLKVSGSWAHNAPPTGQGHLSFDIWLQSGPKQLAGWGNQQNSPTDGITHEIMVPLCNWGNYGSHNVPGGRNPGWYDHDATIAGRLWHVYVTKNSAGVWNTSVFGWKMIAFVPDVPLPADFVVDVQALINYIATRKFSDGTPWGSGREHLVSIELGVEPVVGTGDMTVYNYRVQQQAVVVTPPAPPAPPPAPVPPPPAPPPPPASVPPPASTGLAPFSALPVGNVLQRMVNTMSKDVADHNANVTELCNARRVQPGAPCGGTSSTKCADCPKRLGLSMAAKTLP
jgi:hypothetical protein